MRLRGKELEVLTAFTVGVDESISIVEGLKGQLWRAQPSRREEEQYCIGHDGFKNKGFGIHALVDEEF
jgi:hypothetical protein